MEVLIPLPDEFWEFYGNPNSTAEAERILSEALIDGLDVDPFDFIERSGPLWGCADRYIMEPRSTIDELAVDEIEWGEEENGHHGTLYISFEENAHFGCSNADIHKQHQQGLNFRVDPAGRQFFLTVLDEKLHYPDE